MLNSRNLRFHFFLFQRHSYLISAVYGANGATISWWNGGSERTWVIQPVMHFVLNSINTRRMLGKLYNFLELQFSPWLS